MRLDRSGKTEAAFFPILTLLAEDPPASIGALYVGPLKALINDQFGRLTDLCEEGDIPVWRWHGDVAASRKAKMMKHPSGILQITPESLESMLLHKHSAVPRLFDDLRFVVIDEVHSLMRGDRGGQTLCVIERLSRMAGVNPRRIGLSATVGDPERTGEFLAAGTGRNTVIPRIDDKGQRWRLSMEHFYISDRQATDDVYGAKKGVARARASAADAEEPAATVDIDTAPEALGDASGARDDAGGMGSAAGTGAAGLGDAVGSPQYEGKTDQWEAAVFDIGLTNVSVNHFMDDQKIHGGDIKDVVMSADGTFDDVPPEPRKEIVTPEIALRHLEEQHPVVTELVNKFGLIPTTDDCPF